MNSTERKEFFKTSLKNAQNAKNHALGVIEKRKSENLPHSKYAGYEKIVTSQQNLIDTLNETFEETTI